MLSAKAMQKQIELQSQKIDYTLKISQRARMMRLAIYGDGSLVVTAPTYVGHNLIEEFMVSKARWIIKQLEYFKRFSGSIFFSSSKKDYLKYKVRAMELAKRRLAYFNQSYGFEFNRISIRNQKSRWGSCSKKGNLNFNYKIALIPQPVADYIIVHELCHLKEFNHSPRFWALVAKTVPDYAAIRKELRGNLVK